MNRILYVRVINRIGFFWKYVQCSSRSKWVVETEVINRKKSFTTLVKFCGLSSNSVSVGGGFRGGVIIPICSQHRVNIIRLWVHICLDGEGTLSWWLYEGYFITGFEQLAVAKKWNHVDRGRFPRGSQGTCWCKLKVTSPGTGLISNNVTLSCYWYPQCNNSEQANSQPQQKSRLPRLSQRTYWC